MPRDASVYLQDILEAVARIREYTRSMDSSTFQRDQRTVDAVLHNLKVIGEASKQIPQSLRDKAPEIEWRKIGGMRDLIAHAYFQVDLQVIWDVITSKLGSLESSSRRLLGED